jgi:hypothetical protein
MQQKGLFFHLKSPVEGPGIQLIPLSPPLGLAQQQRVRGAQDTLSAQLMRGSWSISIFMIFPTLCMGPAKKLSLVEKYL